MRVLITILLVLAPLFAVADEIQYKIYSLLRPVVQVRLQRLSDNGGSGTIVYSETFNKKTRTFVLTNYHVVESALRDPGKKNEKREQVDIKIFDYSDYGNKVVSSSYTANIVETDKSLDLALLEIVQRDKWFESVQFAPKDFKLKLFQEVYAVGFTQLKGISANRGHITGLSESRPFQPPKAKLARCNADIYYGFSGGGIFEAENHWLIGMPQSIELSRFGGYPISWMAYFITVVDIRKFIEKNNLEFIEDKKEAPIFELKPMPVPKVFKLNDFIRSIKGG